MALFWGRIYPLWMVVPVFWKIQILWTLRLQSYADLPLIKLSDLGVPKANESSQGHFLNSLNLASDVGSHEEWKGSAVLRGRLLRLSGWQ